MDVRSRAIWLLGGAVVIQSIIIVSLLYQGSSPGLKIDRYKVCPECPKVNSLQCEPCPPSSSCDCSAACRVPQPGPVPPSQIVTRTDSPVTTKPQPSVISSPRIYYHIAPIPSGGLRVGDQITLKASWRPEGREQLVVEFLNEASSHRILHCSFRKNSRVLVINDRRSDWGSEEYKTLPEEACQTNVPFTISIKVKSGGYSLFINGKSIGDVNERRSGDHSQITNCLVLHDTLSEIESPWTFTHISDEASTEDYKGTNVLDLQHKYDVFIGIMSAGKNFKQRSAVRASWLLYPAFREKKALARFFVAKASDESVNEDVRREMQEFGDIVYLDYADSYDKIAFKTLEMCKFTANNVSADFLFKCDDDTFTRVDELLKRLEPLKGKSIYLGTMSSGSGPIRDPNSKWYISQEDYAESSYPTFAHGPGYAVSRDVAEYVSVEDKKHDLKVLKLEDISMATWVDHAKTHHNYHVEVIHDGRFLISDCDNNMISGHYISPVDMKMIWLRIKTGKSAIC